MNDTDNTSHIMAFTIEDRHAFLQLTGDFLQFNRQLPGILAGGDDDSRNTHLLLNQIVTLSTWL